MCGLSKISHELAECQDVKLCPVSSLAVSVKPSSCALYAAPL